MVQAYSYLGLKGPSLKNYASTNHPMVPLLTPYLHFILKTIYGSYLSEPLKIQKNTVQYLSLKRFAHF